jgi:Ca2+-binding RTX toxin-like protein
VNVTGGDTTGTEDTVRVAGLGGDDRLVAQAENLNNSSLVIGFDGGEGTDTVEVNGTAADETFFAARNGTFARIGETAPSVFNLDVAAEQVELNAKGGNDTFNGQNGLATIAQFTIDGGAGNDQLRGTDGADTLIGGLGDDFIDGNIGADTALMGAGNDTFQWDPGDGSDIVEGQGGLDTMQFNGSNIGEVIDLSANGQRLRFTRNVASIVMDVDGVEVVNFRALGGADAVTVHNLAATAVNGVNVDLGAFGGTGDSSADNVVVEGTDGPDVITVAGSAGSATVTGLPVKVTITAAESALDRLTVSAGNGDDVIEASGLGADSIQLTGDGGEGADVLVGGRGNDTLLGGPGDDVLEGGPGNDVLDGGTGDNVLIQ